MGALAPVSSSPPRWIPEDDLLLKNAVEAGASLEALAKGAVCFSRHFTLKELQNRWYSLLYEKNISIEASARILEIGHTVHPRSSKTCGSKVKESVFEKRKIPSLRSHYHALRKRVCTIPCNYSASEFNLPTVACNGNSKFGDNLNAEQTFDTRQEAFEKQQMLYAGSCGFNAGNLDSDAVHAYQGLSNFQTDDLFAESFDHRFLDDTSNHLTTARVCGSGDSISQVKGDIVDKAVEETLQPHNDITHNFDNGEFQNLPGIQVSESLQNISSGNHPEFENVGTSLCAVGPSNNNQEEICARFQENRNIKSEVPDCIDSSCHLDYSSAMAQFDKHGAANSLPQTNNDMNVNPPEVVCALSEPALCDEICFAIPNEAGDFMDISLSFTSDGERILFDLDDEGIISNSCFDGLNNFLMSSPTHDHQDPINKNISADMGNICHTISTVASTSECIEAGSKKLPEDGSYLDSKYCLPDAPSIGLHPYASFEGPVICVLNTEDPDIPCNDDVVLPAKLIDPFSPAKLGHKSKMISSLDSSTKTFTDNGNNALLNKTREGQESSKNNLVPAVPQLGPPKSCPRQKTELRQPENAFSAGKSDNASNGSKKINDSFPALCNGTTRSIEEHAKFEGFRSSFKEKSEESPNAKNPHLEILNVCMKEVEKPVHVFSPSSHTEIPPEQLGFTGQIQAASTSDQDERYSDNDDDLPSFSDVEAMLLDMDLCPDDHESLYFARQVSRYRHADTKKTIIRLEQGAKSYIQRAIALNGAFAIFYGRRLRYYIKKSQVLIGRGTQEVCVDIDLQNEGRANKISRRQAILQMNNNGVFSIRNMGKFPIQVNDKELLTGRCCSLPSGCLIEIRRMSFIFEVNPECAKHYLSATTDKR